MNILPVLPQVVPLATAVLALSARKNRRVQQSVALLGATLHIVVAAVLFLEVWNGGPARLQMGAWAAPFGIVVYVDTLSAGLVVVTAIVHFAVTGFQLANADEDRRRSDFWPLANTLVMGVQGAFLTGDLFNLYVWFEVLLISSFVLVAIGNARAQVEAAAKYVVLNLLSSTCFLVAIALLYGATGTLNLAELSIALHQPGGVPLVSSIAVLFVVGFGIKAAMFPFGLWLPTAYGSPPAGLAALLAGLLTKVGVYAFLRTGALMFDDVVPWFDDLLLVCAFVSMAVGALGALAQVTLRGAVVHSVVFAVGFMLIGISTGTEQGRAGTIAYLLSDMLVVTTLLLVCGEVERITRGRRLTDMGGLYRSHPLLAIAFIVAAFSVAGFPPLVGFWGKLAILDALTAVGRWPGVIAALAGSAVVLASIAQAWSLGVWKQAPAALATPVVAWGRLVPIVLLVALVAVVSFAPGPLFAVADRAAAELSDVEAYRKGVLE
ncbi:MAG: proton-conducting transporter membrane subunit [Deltaproteobacteria bacterium]